MMLSKIISFGAVFIHIAWGGNTRTLNFTSPCPLTIAPHVACTTSIDWVGDQFNNEQCRAAIQRLFNAEVSVHGGTEFEFLSAGAIPFTSNPVMRTPRKYIVGKCTLAIVMLEFFPPGSLPGQDPWGPQDYPDTDVASFQDLWLASDLIETCCLQSRRSPGWALAGLHESIGVFVWTTNSPKDREVPRGVPTLSLQSNFTRLLNFANESEVYTISDA